MVLGISILHKIFVGWPARPVPVRMSIARPDYRPFRTGAGERPFGQGSATSFRLRNPSYNVIYEICMLGAIYQIAPNTPASKKAYGLNKDIGRCHPYMATMGILEVYPPACPSEIFTNFSSFSHHFTPIIHQIPPRFTQLLPLFKNHSPLSTQK